MFCNMSIKDFNQNIPRKKKIATGNQMPFFGERYFHIYNAMVETA